MPATPSADPDSSSEPPLVRVSVGAILRAVPGTTGSGGSTVSDRWSLLLTRRRADAVYAGYWELPGGKIESDESPEQAAVREVREEIGCAVEVLGALEPIEHVYEHARVRLHTVLCRLTADSPHPANLEVAEHAWYPLSGLPWASFLPGNVRLITALCRFLEEWP